MKRTYLLEDLDCAHCATKIEEAVSKLEGVSKSTLTFLTQKLVIEVDETKEKQVDAEIKKIVKKLEPDVMVIIK